MIRRKISVLAMAAAVLVLPASLAWADGKSDPVLVSHGDVKVTKSDVEKLASMEVPPQRLPEFWSNDRLVRQLIANIFITRMIAKEGRDAGLEQKRKWTLEYLQDRNLMLMQMSSVVEKKLAKVNLKELAKEYYRAHPDEFQRPAEVHAEHILISTQKRDDAAAKKRAEMVLAKVKANPDAFAKLADKYSDDPSVKQNHGDLGFFAKKQMVKPFADAAFGLKKDGDIAGPVKSKFGYHIIRLLGRKKPGLEPFAEVEAKLEAKERKRLANQYKQELVEKVKSMKGIKTNQAAVDSLIKKLPAPK